MPAGLSMPVKDGRYMGCFSECPEDSTVFKLQCCSK